MMRIRVGECLKIVAILAVGLGYGEWVYRKLLGSGEIALLGTTGLTARIDHFQVRVLPILAGMIMVMGIATWMERILRRPGRPWGVGRWSASAGTFIVAFSFLYASVPVIADWMREGRLDPEICWDEWAYDIPREQLDRVGHVYLVSLACWISAKLTGWKGDPQPDATEWLGRLLLIAACCLTTGVALFHETRF